MQQKPYSAHKKVQKTLDIPNFILLNVVLIALLNNLFSLNNLFQICSNNGKSSPYQTAAEQQETHIAVQYSTVLPILMMIWLKNNELEVCDKSSKWMTSPSILQYIFVHKKARPLEGCGFQRNNSIGEENSGDVTYLQYT